ncbi:Sensor protein DivL [compost metagenome]
MRNPGRRHSAARAYLGAEKARRPREAARAIAARCQALAVLAAWTAIAFGLAGLVGWTIRAPLLLAPLPGSPAITFSAACLLVVAGTALLLLRPPSPPAWRRWLGLGLALLLVALSIWQLLANVFGWGLATGTEGLRVIVYPQTAFTFLFMALAMLTLDAPRGRWAYPAEVFALATFAIPYVALLGYAFGFVVFAPHIQMAVHGAISLALLGLALLCARPQRGWMKAFTRASPGGLVLRRFLPAIMIGPPLLGLLRIEAERLGLLDDTTGLAVLVLAITAVTMVLAVWNAVTLDHLDSERQRSEEYLRQFQLLVSSVTDYAIFLLDRRGRVRTWNASAERLKGYRQAEILGQSFRRFFTPDELKERLPQRLLKEAATTGHAQLEGWRVERDGVRRWEELVLTALREATGRLVGFAVITRDMTERKQAYEKVAQRTAELAKARELNQLKDLFLSTVSHEMRTPLSLITGYAELLEDTGANPDLVAGIQEGSRRLTAHIDRILDYSALLSGALPLYLTEVNLTEVAENAKAVLADAAMGQQQAIALEVDPQTPPIRGDSRRITQMIVELLVNAQKVTPPKGTLGLRIGPSGSDVRIDVWDTGPGISEEDFPRIWEAFTQHHLGDTTCKEGLGLGLSIVKQLAELHGGKVAVVSQLGRGTTFTLTLPVSGPAHPEPGAATSDTEAPGEPGPGENAGARR